MTTVQIEGPLAVVEFDSFGLDNYPMFLRCKKLPESQVSYDWQTDTYKITTPARFARMLGDVEVPVEKERLPLAEHLFDYQRWILDMALTGKRFAVWADTGLGKTAMFLEFARQVLHLTGGHVLILSPLNIIAQTVAEAEKFYGEALPVRTLRTREELSAWCTSDGSGLGICNYDKMIPGVLNEFRYLSGLILDEASILKAGGGVIKWNLIKSAREEDDERHVCPLQLEVIRRLIRLYSNPGETVLDPFMGIGSTACVAFEQGRNAVGFELKESYHRQALANIELWREKANAKPFDLFALAGVNV